MKDKITEEDITIEYHGLRTTVKQMLEDLEHGQAVYWFWHTLLYNFVKLHRICRNEFDFGILLSEEPILYRKSWGDTAGRISQGVYNKKELRCLVKKYLFIVNKVNDGASNILVG